MILGYSKISLRKGQLWKTKNKGKKTSGILETLESMELFDAVFQSMELEVLKG